MKIIFCGYSGKVGSILYKELKKEYDVLTVDIKTPLENSIKFCDLVIDFTNKDACFKHALMCAENKIPFISGTTGLSKKELKDIEEAFIKSDTGALMYSNFSIGMNNLLKDIHHYSSFDSIIIYEEHHKSKLDLPSGTALKLKEAIGKDVPIVSKRSNSYIVNNKIVLENDYEELIITHKVKNKLAYYKLLKEAIDEVFLIKGLKTM